jgi:hypothetical protein
MVDVLRPSQPWLAGRGHPAVGEGSDDALSGIARDGSSSERVGPRVRHDRHQGEGHDDKPTQHLGERL